MGVEVAEQIADLVSHHPLLSGLPGDGVDLVAGCAKNVVFAAGSFLLREGEAADSLYLVRRGKVNLEIHSPGRGPIVVETLGPGDVVGWSWLFPPYRWHLDARALEPVGAITVDAACLRGKADTDPAFGYEIMKRFATVMLGRLDASRLRLLDIYG